MTKHVFSNSSECIHIWANRVQEYGRSSNVSFRSSNSLNIPYGNVIYSYNTPIAAFRESSKGLVILMDGYGYSHTTGKMQRAIPLSVTTPLFIYDSIPKWVEKEVSYVSRHGNSNPLYVQSTSIWEQYKDIYNALLISANNKRNSRTANDRVILAFKFAKKANTLKEYFLLGDDCPVLDCELTSTLAEALASIEKLKKERESRELKENKQKCLDWINGVRDVYPNANSSPIVLRIKPNDAKTVETSRGAFVPLSACKKLYQAYKAQSIESLDTLKIGYYEVTKISSTGITVGCHDISAKEIERFAKIVGVE